MQFMALESSNPQPSPARQRFLQRLAARSIKPAARDYYVRWAEAWTKALGHRSAERTQAFFDALGRTAHLADWQFRQAVDAIYILAHEILTLPWAAAYDWQGLADQAWALEPDHRTLGRENIPVRAVLPQSGSGILPQSVSGASRSASTSISLPDTDAEIDRIVTALRRSIRLAGLAYATEQTYIHWNIRFTRFCLECLKQPPQDAGTPALTAYLSYLALERNVSDSTQNQALNAMVFLTRKVFGVEEFTIDKPAHGHIYRRPPIVLSRREITAILAHLDTPWSLAAQLMFGSGLRLMECLRLRAKDFNFDQGTITIHDGKGNKHRVVPLPQALEDTLKDHLAKARDKHLRDLAVGPEKSTCRNPCCANGPTHRGSGLGNISLPPQPSAPIHIPDGSPAITCTRHPCSVSSRTPSARPISPNSPPATRCATRSRRVSSKMAPTSAPFRTSSAMPTSPPP
jgi:hypothetical protein